MENDREMLELAAKAAGMELVAKGNHYRNSDGAIYPFGGANGWNPLADDGDALRLAVKLGMSIYSAESSTEVTTCSERVGWTTEDREDHNNDPYAATRRAIVRAAAEIGKEMNRG